MKPVVEISPNLIINPEDPKQYGLLLGQYNGKKVFLEVFPEETITSNLTIIPGSNKNWKFSDNFITNMFAHNQVDEIDDLIISNPSVLTRQMIANMVSLIANLMNKSLNEAHLAVLTWINQ